MLVSATFTRPLKMKSSQVEGKLRENGTMSESLPCRGRDGGNLTGLQIPPKNPKYSENSLKASRITDKDVGVLQA